MHCLSEGNSNTSVDEIQKIHEDFIQELSKLKKESRNSSPDYGAFAESALGIADIIGGTTPESESLALPLTGTMHLIML